VAYLKLGLDRVQANGRLSERIGNGYGSRIIDERVSVVFIQNLGAVLSQIPLIKAIN
jgi:hypothetical protein